MSSECRCTGTCSGPRRRTTNLGRVPFTSCGEKWRTKRRTSRRSMRMRMRSTRKASLQPLLRCLNLGSQRPRRARRALTPVRRLLILCRSRSSVPGMRTSSSTRPWKCRRPVSGQTSWVLHTHTTSRRVGTSKSLSTRANLTSTRTQSWPRRNMLKLWRTPKQGIARIGKVLMRCMMSRPVSGRRKTIKGTKTSPTRLSSSRAGGHNSKWVRRWVQAYLHMSTFKFRTNSTDLFWFGLGKNGGVGWEASFRFECKVPTALVGWMI
mmetsp:Transcript_27082/g.48844  ORF Transcript_27082/g.48844 Transcript_27082/m.48844 type:complete len:265 (-) Transcript_27082:674-1468(-)